MEEAIVLWVTEEEEVAMIGTLIAEHLSLFLITLTTK